MINGRDKGNWMTGFGSPDSNWTHISNRDMVQWCGRYFFFKFKF